MIEIVTLIITIVNAAVEMASGFIQLGITEGDDPVNIFEWNRDSVWPAALQGLDRTRTEKNDLQTEYGQATAYIANPDNWWNKAAGTSRDPFYMEGQKQIVRNYPGYLAQIERTRGPGIDNHEQMVSQSSWSKKGNIHDYRLLGRTALVKVLTFGMLSSLFPNEDLTYAELSFMDPATLRKLWPADQDTAEGRLPASLRGELLAHYIGVVYSGHINLASPVPWWLLGFNTQEYHYTLANRLPMLTAMQLLQMHRRRHDSVAQYLASRYAA